MIGDIPDNINKIVLEYVSAFYGLPKELRLAIVSEARENHHIWEKMWAPASVFVGEQYRYQLFQHTGVKPIASIAIWVI